jgi:hypothetical protein
MARRTKHTDELKAAILAQEPPRLVEGKGFHAELQDNFIRTSEGTVTRERPIRTPSGRLGRIDIHIVAGDDLDAVVEFKRSNWDAMAPHRIGPNIRRYIRQVWRYIEAVMEEGKDVSPGIVFANKPKDPDLKRRIEKAFEDDCITIIWDDDTTPEI